MAQLSQEAADHLGMMDHRIQMQKDKISRLEVSSADVSEAIKKLKLLENTKEEMRQQLVVLSRFR